MRLYLVRHAQSEANVHKILDTALPGPPLTELGRKQADALIDTFVPQQVAAVYASHATRAQQTAAPLADALSLPVRVLDGVHEVSVGDLEGRGDREAIEAYGTVVHQWVQGNLDVPLPGGESGRQVRSRYLAAVDAIRERHLGTADTVVLVSHGGAIRLAAEWLAPNVTPEITDTGLLPNTAHVRLDADPDHVWRCSEWAGIPVSN
ncbi:phosphoglycerate kinase [Saccharomonospora sp. CUA-673]|uniref:histidine phosphatase family protein n=1 Tax=Saccharomonospora sp. CUA-673 TaxID=1904969 RepID=UPI00096433B3|nr:histidine phosphatase family protein [Saccharomonospora sp. CUA-673]OLT39049.1 phosphoglycerate kinase [Saccharomonospora sp. CUA-673]